MSGHGPGGPRRLRAMTTVRARPSTPPPRARHRARGPRRCSEPPARFREGHFLLKSGRHGDAYVEKFQVLQDPAATSELCGFFADPRPGRRRRAAGRPRRRARRPAGSSSPSRPPASSASGASSPRRSAADDGTLRREFRRGFRIEPGERVLLVDDILTTGGSLLAMLPAVEAMGGEIVECVVLVDRSGGRATPHVAGDRPRLPAALALAARPADLRAGPGTCPRCADGTPLHAPGQHRDRRRRQRRRAG